MGLDSVTAWVVVRRYDEKDDESEEETPSPPVAIKLKQNSNLNELKAQIRSWLGLPENGKVIKLRGTDERLVPLSSLLEGNGEQSPFLLDVVCIHQHAMVSQRTSLLPIYIASIRSNINALEERVGKIETMIPDYQSQREAQIEQAVQQLSSKVSFLDRRLDELAPVEWRAQIQQSAISSELPEQKT